jgi:hypothetical protein
MPHAVNESVKALCYMQIHYEALLLHMSQLFAARLTETVTVVKRITIH